MTEIKEVSEREIMVGESRFYLDDENTIHMTIVGRIDGELAHKFNETTLNLMDMVEGKVNVFVNINKTGKLSSESRKIFSKFVEHEKYGKLAIFGVHPVARVLASFFMGVSKKRDMRFFKTKEEALAWLKEGE